MKKSTRHMQLLRSIFGAGMITIPLLMAMAPALHGQDTRNGGRASEPVFPATTCAQLFATQATMTVSGNPEPASETAFDTGRIQAALNGCAQAPGSNHASVGVELSAAGANNAFLFQAITVPVGVTLVVDGGVTMFASRNPCDYQATAENSGVSGSPSYCVGGSMAGVTGSFCGQLGNHGWCIPMITVAADAVGTESTVGSGIMGYGVIDGRGTDTMTGPNTVSYGSPYNLTVPYTPYQLTLAAYANGGAGSQATPSIIFAYQASNFSLYKITLLNAPYFNVKWYAAESGSVTTSGFTVWGMKILAPNNIENTDGIDPLNLIKDVTIAYTYISNGDDNVAINAYGPNGYPAQDITIDHLYTFSGLGISIGSDVNGGVNNVLIENATQNGTVLNGAFPEPVLSTGFHIKSTAANGGPVNNVVYENACMRNQAAPIRISPFAYGSGTNNIPTFTNINISNVTIEPNVAFNGTPVSGLTNYFYFAGYDASHVSTVTLNNVYSYVTPTFTFPSDQSVKVPEYVNFTLGPAGGITFPSPATLSSITSLGPGITITGTPPAATPMTCTFPQLNGELYAAVANGSGVLTTNNAASAAITLGQTVQLNAVIQPSAEEFPRLGQPVQFYSGTTLVGTGTLTSNSTGNFVSFPFTPTAAGTYKLTAQYSGTGSYADANYPAAFPFGSVVVTVAPPPGIALTSSVSTISVGPGSSGTLTLSVVPSGGFSGTVALTCSSPVRYVTCVVSIPSVTVSGTTAGTSTAVITVAATTGALRGGKGWAMGGGETMLALLAPLGLLASLRRRRFLAQAGAAVLLVWMGVAMSGCGGTSTAAASSGPTAPSGSQTVMFTATSGALVQTVPVTVTIP